MKTEPPQLYSYFKREKTAIFISWHCLHKRKALKLSFFVQRRFYLVLFFFIIPFFLFTFDDPLLRPHIVSFPGSRLLCLCSCILSFIISAPISCITRHVRAWRWNHAEEILEEQFKKRERENSPKEKKK